MTNSQGPLDAVPATYIMKALCPERFDHRGGVLLRIVPPVPGTQILTPPPSLPEITVVSIPSGHPYPQTVGSAKGICVLPDPIREGAPASQWWPPVALDPAWIRANASAADLLHIHFGTESFSPVHLAESIAAAHDVGWPVVFTVHDLEHPQLTDQGPYRAQLDVLIPGADALLTLTAGAAREILRRWGRTALVVPHPAVVTEGAHPRPATSTSTRIGMHLKDLRSNIDSVTMVTALCEAVDTLTKSGHDVTAEVRMHREVRDEVARKTIRAILHKNDRVVLLEHQRLNDSELEVALARLDVAVLPYAHGTHSGWLELCWDLGTAIAAPRIGYYAQQHTDGTVVSFSGDSLSGESAGRSLADAITDALASPRATRPGTPEREAEVARRAAARAAELELLTAIHAGLYRKLVRERVLVAELQS
jgi:hypothetical protein